MPLLISALLLAVWLSHPWTYVDLPRVTDAQAQISLSHSYTATMTVDPDVSLLKRSRNLADEPNIAAQPPAPVPPAPAAAPVAPVATPAPPQATPAPPTEGLEAIVCSYSWPCDQALDVARCESGVDRAGRLDGIFATSGSSYGLFQLNGIHARRFPDFWEKWMDPVTNVPWAYQIWPEQWSRPWSCRPSGRPSASNAPSCATSQRFLSIPPP